MSNPYRGLSIDASYQVSVHLAKRFQRRRFLQIDQSETRTACGGCLFMDRDEMSNLQRTYHRCFPPSFGSFGQTVSEEKNFKNQPIRNKNRLWRPCLLMDRDKLSNLYRGPPIDDTYQVSVYLAKKIFRNQPIRNKNCLWRPCLLTDRDEISNLYRGPSKDASY